MPVERASFEEFLAFCNKVREAGGGNPIDALLPAVPEDTSKCLVAKNLNFNCRVNGGPNGSWHMYVSDPALAERISEATGCEFFDGLHEDDDFECGVVLPPEIGQVASDFDAASDVANNIEYAAEEAEECGWDEAEIKANVAERLSEADLSLLKAMWPYIDASVKEAYDLATIVNEDGSIVL